MTFLAKEQNKEEAKEGSQGSPKKQDSAAEEKTKQPAASGDAQSILDEEKDNTQQRNAPTSGGYSEVDRDW